jgi:hypothetical protein
VTIQIGVHLIGEEPDQHIVCVALRVSRMATIPEVPTMSKSGLCSRDEVLAPSDRPAWQSFRCLILLPLNHLEAGQERFDKVVTGLLGLPGPINSICGGQYKSKLVHRGQNDAVLNRHRRGLPP